ncbi:hypothetical protein LTS09_017735 [Friedmanniomyces endolithicus]|nr:hypothetical protein LTS09_017735 [Friedmanniomyces endolithicus]
MLGKEAAPEPPRPLEPHGVRRSQRLKAQQAAITNQRHGLPSPQRNDFQDARKRKRTVEDSEDTCAKRLQTNQRHSSNVANSFGGHSSAVYQKDLINYWRQNDFQWSSVLKDSTAMEDKRSSRPSRPGKRALSRSDRHDVEDDIEVATSGDEEEGEEKDEEEDEEEAAEDVEEEDAEEEGKEEGKAGQDKRDSSVVIAPGNTVDSSHRHARSQVACNHCGGKNSLALRFSSLSLQSSREKQLLDSFCITNDVANLQGMLDRTSDPLTLIETQESSLIATCEEGHGEVVAILLDYGVSLNTKDRHGDAALQKAINAGFGSIGLRLIEAGANITGIDSKGSTLLDAAGEML